MSLHANKTASVFVGLSTVQRERLKDTIVGQNQGGQQIVEMQEPIDLMIDVNLIEMTELTVEQTIGLIGLLS